MIEVRGAVTAGLIVVLSAGYLRAGNPTVPFSFVRNVGQAPAAVKYIGNGPEFKAWFFDTGVTFQQGGATTHMEFEGGDAKAGIYGADPTGAMANYLRGNDRNLWKTGLPMVSTIHYQGVWPGIEVRFKAENGRTKAEYAVAPHATPSQIRLRFDGVASIRPDGSLAVRSSTGEFTEGAPVLYQETASGRIPVRGAFRKVADSVIGFEVTDYDASRELVIDPSILFSGYFGGSSQSTITSVIVNASYGVVAAGWTIGTDLPSGSGAKPHNAGGVDAFVAEFSPSGGTLLFCTYLGGARDDRATGVAVDSANNVYVTGYSSSLDFPVVNAYQSKLKGTRDAFVAKLNAAGNALVYSTYIGGTGVDSANALVVDPTDNSVVITGDTTSPGMASSGVSQTALAGGQDVFLARLSPGGALNWFTYFGGSGSDHSTCLRLDQAGTLNFGGGTYSTDLPTRLPFQASSGGGQDGFVARMSADGRTLLLSTFVGGSGGSPGAMEQVNGLSVGTSGSLLVAGTTSSMDFPILAKAMQSIFGGGQTDGFLVRINPANGKITASTFVGGSGDDGINGIASDSASLVYITGYTSSQDFPTLNPLSNSKPAGMDAFVTKMAFDHMLFSTYLGGAGADCGNAISIDSMTNIVVAGSTGSPNFPVSGHVGGNQGAALGSFITKLAPNFTLAVTNGPLIYLDSWRDTGYDGTVSGNLTATSFGQAGDTVMVNNWLGDGVRRLALFRNGTWIVDSNNNGIVDAGDATIQFGQAGDLPVAGDWTGTGRIKLGLYRQGSFILDLSGHLAGAPTGLADATFHFGLTGDLPVVGDWNGDGKAKVGVFRSGQWLVDLNGDRVFDSLDKTYTYGQTGDIPVVGDWNSSGKANQLGVYRQGLWILNVSGSSQWTSIANELVTGFGSASYKPAPF